MNLASRAERTVSNSDLERTKKRQRSPLKGDMVALVVNKRRHKLKPFAHVFVHMYGLSSEIVFEYDVLIRLGEVKA